MAKQKAAEREQPEAEMEESEFRDKLKKLLESPPKHRPSDESNKKRPPKVKR